MKTIVLIGDSIRMGYQDEVRQQLAEYANVWAPTQNGGDSANVLAHVDEWVVDRRPDLVHINCGLHDIKRDHAGENLQTEPEAYRRNVEAILSRLSAVDGLQTVWAQTTPVIEERHRTVKGFVRLNSDIRRCNQVAAELCQAHGVPVNDLHAVVMDAGREALLSPDGVHYTHAGYHLLAHAAADFIASRL